MSPLESWAYHLWAVVVVVGMNFSILSDSLGLFQSFLLLDVILLVEVGEEEQEHNSMKANPHHEPFGIFAIRPK